jgi:predicted ATPase with chaperone activity
MLARRLTAILPAMSLAEALATTRLYRVAGLTAARTTVVTSRPCVPRTRPSRLWG